MQNIIQNRPVQDLKDEHEGIILMLDIMKKVSKRLKGRIEVKKEHLAYQERK